MTIDLRRLGSHEVSEACQAFALLCAREEVSGALLDGGEEGADAHHALRDTLVTLACIARVPLRFRLALVARSGAIEALYREAQRELRALDCDARMFPLAGDAARWLSEGVRRAAPATPVTASATAAPAPAPHTG